MSFLMRMLSSILGGDKEYLYLTLSHRHELPGYHCALVLSPEDQPDTEQDTSDEPDSVRWHLTNQAPAPGGRGKMMKVPWHMEFHDFNMVASISLIARFTLGKFKTRDHKATVQRIAEAVNSVPIDNDDPNLTCKTWLMQVIDILISEGIVKLSVPHAAALADRAKYQADEVMKKITARQIDITKKSAIPLFDMRANQD